MSQPPVQSVIGSVIERPSSSRSSFQASTSSSPSGFPSVQHRSKSAFARAREAKQNGTQYAVERRSRKVPVVHRSGKLLSNNRENKEEEELVLNSDDFFGPSNASSSNTNPQSEDKWKRQMKNDNERTIESMSEEERERHVREIMEQLGPNVGDLLRKAREARTGSQAGSEAPKQEPKVNDSAPKTRDEAHKIHEMDDDVPVDIKPNIETESVQPAPTVPQSPNKLASPTRGILVSSSTPVSRSSSPGRGPRKLRFADVTSKDVHVFQSEPSSPRRTIGLLPPLDSDGGSGPTQSLRPKPKESSLEEGTPEDIRRRFFPHLPANEPSLEWIESDDKSTSVDSEPRFDLTGTPISVAERDSLPTHLGLHHHGGPSTAGYTLTDLFLLARSSVPAQRATVLSVLTKIVRKLARLEDSVSEIKDRDSVRSRALVVGLAALTEKGSLGVQAIELAWTCIVFWDEDEVEGLEGIELKPLNVKSNKANEQNKSEDLIPSFDPLSSLPLPALLPQIAALLDGQNLPHESLSQLLSIVHRFAQHSVEIATAVSEAPQLIANVVRTFLLTPIPPPENGLIPNPRALDLLHILALSSRTNARTLEGPADALLRFITSAAPLSASPFPHALTAALLCKTFDLYSILGKYGIYSGVATTAAEHFGRLSASILVPSDNVSEVLKVSWLRLLSVWMVCARDPHRTTPTHDLLWSQVVGWTWGEDLLSFREKLLEESSTADDRIWGALWDALGSWLEGCRVNSVKTGQDERNTVNAAIEKTWTVGYEKKVVEGTVTQLKQELSDAFAKGVENIQRKRHIARITSLSQTLGDFVKMCLGCLPKLAQTPSEEGAHTFLWLHEAISIISPAILAIIFCNGWSPSGRSPAESNVELITRAQLFHLRPASSFLISFLKLLRVISTRNSWLPQSVAALETLLPGDEEDTQWIIEELINKECTEAECAGKMKYLMPFFKNMIRPDESIYLSPLSPTPDSIQLCTTQCLPADCLPSTSRRARFGLPLARDWSSVALDHLLRSGTSPILTNPESVPNDWNASETDLVQASLSLMHHLRNRLIASDLPEFALGSGHAILACMKVFMLEHNQHQNDSNEEVFRDTVVGNMMEMLLIPFAFGNTPSESEVTQSTVNLEMVAKGFLGAGTPFYQFYTDFVALFDAISFSHDTFARLLLPPTSMAYETDYRKLLWGDYGHTLRTIRTSIEDVLAPSLKPYLWPLEKDVEMLGWYLRALIKWPLVGFMRFIAIHHIACSIWPDLQKGEESQTVRDKRSRMLLVAISNQASHDVVKDIVRYVQDQSALKTVAPPACYKCQEELRTERLTFVKAMGESRILENIEKIFAAED